MSSRVVLSDARGAARIHPPNDVGCNSDPLDVGDDIGSGIEQVKVEDFVVTSSV